MLHRDDRDLKISRDPCALRATKADVDGECCLRADAVPEFRLARNLMGSMYILFFTL